MAATPGAPFPYRVTIVEGGVSRPLGGVREIAGLDRIRVAPGGTVTLRGGTVRQGELQAWMRQGGDSSRTRTIRIDEVSEDRVVRSWHIVNARPVKYMGPPLNASGNEVAIEELALSAEGIEVG